MYSFQLRGLLIIAYLGLQINGLNLNKLNLEGFPEQFQLHFFQKREQRIWEQGTVDKNSRKAMQSAKGGSHGAYKVRTQVPLLKLPYSNAKGEKPTNFQPTNFQPTNFQPTNFQAANLGLAATLREQSTNLQPPNLNPSRFFQPANLEPSPDPTCSVEVETLTSLLLKDLPSYANRVIQRARRSDSTVDNFSYVIVAGKPEFEPLPLKSFQSTTEPNPTDSEALQQIFLTTLERKYFKDKAVELQNYHWLFLTKSSDGWRLVMIFSRIGSVSEGKLPTPPRESTNGVIGQAVKTWLRDCRAGTIRGFEQNPVNSDP